MFHSIWGLLPKQSIIEGVGNELLFVAGFAGLCLFIILAWMSTGVSWELLPVRITLVRPSYAQDTVDNRIENLVEATTPNNSSETLQPEDIHSDDKSDSNSEETVDDTISGESEVIKGRNGTLAEQEQYAVRFRSKGHLVLRLQYVNDQVRYVHAAPTTLISRFKRKHFAEELVQQRKHVRLIFQGRELIEREPPHRPISSLDTGCPPSQKFLRLCDYDIRDGSVIHCLITTMASNTSTLGTHQSGPNSRSTDRNSTQSYSLLTEFDMGTRLMEPLFAFLLAFTWFFRIAYRQYFNSVSTFALIALSVFFCGAVLAVNFMNATSALASFATRRSDSRTNGTSNAVPPHNGSTETGDVRVLTVTMVARSPWRERHPTHSNESEGSNSTTVNTPVIVAPPQDTEPLSEPM